MNEILYAGSIPLDTMPQIVATCQFGPDALFLAEHIPTHTIVTPEERRNLLCFTYANKGPSCEDYSSGRIFQEDRELRWEKQRDVLRVVYLGPQDSTIAEVLHKYGLKDRQKVLDGLAKSAEPTWYSLFGERLKSEDLPYFGKNAQVGDFVVVRIPRILRYPVPPNDEPSARLLVCEYHNKVTDSVELFRFQAVKTWNDKKRGGSA